MIISKYQPPPPGLMGGSIHRWERATTNGVYSHGWIGFDGADNEITYCADGTEIVPDTQEDIELRRSKHETRLHIHAVQCRIDHFILKMSLRASAHDASKLEPPEAEGFATCTNNLKGLTYGSDEYRAQLAEMKPFLDHHYANNSHHPEHYPEGIAGMDLLDLVEMFCDWWAASERHADGNIIRSIDINEGRFGMPPVLCSIFKNTVNRWEE